jgi:hypothetical protein
MYHITQSVIAIPSGGSILRNGDAGAELLLFDSWGEIGLEDRLIVANKMASEGLVVENL